MCTPWIEDEGFYDMLFISESCPGAADPKLDEPVEAAIAEATQDCLDLLPLAGDAYERVYPVLEESGDPASARAAALEVFWDEPLLGETLLHRTQMRLAERGVTCGDCEASPQLPTAHRRVTWSELQAYVQAYVWPVQGDGAVDVYVCGGTNGLAALPEDDRLARAGFIMAVHLTGDPGLEALFSELSAQSASLDEYHARVRSYLTDGRTRKSLCEQLARFEWFLRMQVAECSDERASRTGGLRSAERPGRSRAACSSHCIG